MGMRVLQWALYGLATVCLAAVAFGAGVLVAKKTTIPPVMGVVLDVSPSDRAAAADFVEAGLCARFAGKPDEAAACFRAARRLDPRLRGLDYQIGLAELDLGNFDGAAESAARAVARGEETGNARTLAAMASMQRAMAAGSPESARKEVMDSLDAAREADPLNPAPHYVTGEFLRAVGEPQAAAAAYRRALHRVAVLDNVFISTVKAGLTGQRLNYRSLDPAMKISSVDGIVPPEQLFFAAADALLRGDHIAARDHLREAQKRVPDEVFKVLLQDSFFQDYLPYGSFDPQNSLPQG